MKKLMIAMSAAAMAALCAQAGIPKDYTSGIDFENTATGNLNVLLDDTNTQQGDTNTQQGDTNTQQGTDLKFWASAAASKEDGTKGQVESQIVDGSQIQGSENTGKFLKVDETVPLQRSMAGVDEKGIPKPTSVGDGIEISSSVQFTAADEAPKPNDGDKLLVWMQAAADAEGTEGEPGYKPAKKAGVMVTHKTGTTMIKEVTNVEAFTAAWHTLVIKAVAAGTVVEPTTSFMVTLDGDQYGPFVSLVTGGGAAQTISSIGFQGTGAVDDIGFKALEAAPDVTVTVAVTGKAVIYTDEDFSIPYDKLPIVVKAGTTVTLYVEDTVGTLKVTSTAGTVGEYDAKNTVWPVSFTTDAANTKVTLDIKVEQGGEPGPENPSINPAAGESTITIRAATSSVAEEQAIAAIKAPSGVDAATYKAYFMATAAAEQDGTYTVTVELNPAVVTPAVVDDANLDIAAGAITVSSKVGLWYSLVKGTTLSTITNVVDTQAGTGEVLTLDDSSTKGDAAFYKVSVTADKPTASVAPVPPVEE